jgi:cell division protein FtsB
MRESSAAWLIPFVLLVLTLVSVPMLVMGPEGLPRHRLLSSELERLRASNQRVQREVEALGRTSVRLREDPRAVERIARDELGLIEDGELIFQFPN